MVLYFINKHFVLDRHVLNNILKTNSVQFLITFIVVRIYEALYLKVNKKIHKPI